MVILLRFVQINNLAALIVIGLAEINIRRYIRMAAVQKHDMDYRLPVKYVFRDRNEIGIKLIRAAHTTFPDVRWIGRRTRRRADQPVDFEQGEMIIAAEGRVPVSAAARASGA